MVRLRLTLAVFLLTVCWAGAGCEPPAPEAATPAVRPALANAADSLAMRAYDAAGGPAAWAALPYLRFHFGAEREGVAQPGVRHLWDRRTGAYRLQLPVSADTTVVVLFNVNTREGQAYLDGALLDSAQTAQRLEQAYGRFINDTYWLLAPFKLFDPGVTRTLAADSSDAATEALHLAFADVGLTPGDQYWLFIDRATGRLVRWHFRLQSGREGRYMWTGYEEHATAADPLFFATRKEAPGGAFALLTDHIDTPATVDPALFTDPVPQP